MTALTRIRMLQRIFKRKFGPVGEVASRYLESGAHVRINHPTRYGAIHVLVYKDGEKYAIEVFNEPRSVPMTVIENLAEKAKLVRAKPILVLYGDGPTLSGEAYLRCKELGVKIRRIRAR